MPIAVPSMHTKLSAFTYSLRNVCQYPKHRAMGMDTRISPHLFPYTGVNPSFLTHTFPFCVYLIWWFTIFQLYPCLHISITKRVIRRRFWIFWAVLKVRKTWYFGYTGKYTEVVNAKSFWKDTWVASLPSNYCSASLSDSSPSPTAVVESLPVGTKTSVWNGATYGVIFTMGPWYLAIHTAVRICLIYVYFSMCYSIGSGKI